MTTFENVWLYLQSNLRTGTEVNNWTAFKGYLGDKMTVVGVRSDYKEVDAPKAMSIQKVPKDDFEAVWEVWTDYKNQKVRRYELTDMTRFSKYIISILHWYEEEV